ncbi:MAG: alginate lyase family protein [Terracidiphilus sp.]|jgi:poly(beta-D-mannuronate) lyase
MRLARILAAVLALALPAFAQHVTDPHASVVDVAARQTVLQSTGDPLLRAAIKGLHFCVAMPPVPAPVGRMIVPHHYLSGSNGPTNPAEAPATRIYAIFEARITAGMNQYLATGSHAESACALAQLDAWAQARALLDYDRKESSQAWFQVEWTLSSAGIADSVLVNDSTLDPEQQRRVNAWLRTAAHQDISFEKSSDSGNNHHYWRALAATAIGVAAGDDKLFRFGIRTYKEAIEAIDPRGAFPLEMARHENAIHYQGFALQPLVLIAQFASRQGIDLYAYESHGRSLRDAIVFFGRAVEDPSLVRPYTADTQAGGFGSGDFADFAFYVARFGAESLPPAIVHALEHPTATTRLGGSTTLLAAR